MPPLVATGILPSLAAVRPVIDGYFARSIPLTTPSSSYAHGKGIFLTNESQFPRAIAPIEDAGGAYVGVGQLMSFTYPAWQQARHAYAVDLNRLVPLGFIPMFGALLCMATDRAAFISLISGRDPVAAPFVNGEAPESLLEAIRGERADERAFDALIRGLMEMIAERLPPGARTTTASTIQYWMQQLKRSCEHHRPNDPDFPGYFGRMAQADAAGRGALLASDESYRRSRELFLEGRITGIASDLFRGGLAAARADFRARGLVLRTLYISNIEGLAMNSGVPSLCACERPDAAEEFDELCRLYASLRIASASGDVRLITANALSPTIVRPLGRFLERAIPRLPRIDDCARAAIPVYPLRNSVERHAAKPRERRLASIGEDLQRWPSMSEIFDQARLLSAASPLSATALDELLRGRSSAYAGRLGEPSRGLVLRNFQDLGFIAAG